MESQKLTIRIRPAAKKALAEHAKKHRTTITGIVQQAVADLLNQDGRRDFEAVVIEKLSEILRVVKGFEIVEDAPTTPTKSA